MARVRDGGPGVGGGWFKVSISKKVGNGMDTFFWTDPWLGGASLVVRFRHLYELSVNKGCSVGDMFAMGWEEGKWEEQWRLLWDWEEELLAWCKLLLSDVILQVSTSDQ